MVWLLGVGAAHQEALSNLSAVGMFRLILFGQVRVVTFPIEGVSEAAVGWSQSIQAFVFRGIVMLDNFVNFIEHLDAPDLKKFAEARPVVVTTLRSKGELLYVLHGWFIAWMVVTNVQDLVCGAKMSLMFFDEGSMVQFERCVVVMKQGGKQLWTECQPLPIDAASIGQVAERARLFRSVAVETWFTSLISRCHFIGTCVGTCVEIR